MSAERALSPAEEIDAEAVAWFVERGEARTEEAQAAFDAWLAQSPKHLLAYWRVEAGWDHAGLLAAVRPPRDLRDGAARPSRERRDWRLWFVGLGAIAAVLIAGIFAGFPLAGGHMTTYATPVGGSRTIALADGSRIELNTDTVVRVGVDRNVELVRGEAFFRVKHDPAHPFIVAVGGERLVDLGTEFLVRRDAERTQIGLVEGSVQLQTAGFWLHSPLAKLTPGDLAVATADRILITQNAASEVSDALAWRTGRLIFRRATLGDAAAEFNRYNEEKLVVADARIADLRFSSVFPIHGIEAFARVARESLGLRVERRDGDIVITR